MRKLKRIAASIVLAVATFLAIMFDNDFDEEAEAGEQPEDIQPITPVYDDTHEILAVNERRQAHETKLARARSVEVVRQAKAVAVKAKPKPKQVAVSRASNYVGQAQTFSATAYTAYCEGCTGITKTGVDLRKSIYYEGRRVIATDPRWIPLGSIVRVTLADGVSFEAVASDTGGAIKGAIIDVAHETTADALEFGRQTVEVRMIKRGGR